MNKKIILIGKNCICLFLVISIAGCSLVDGTSRSRSGITEMMKSEMSEVVIDQWGIIEPQLAAEIDESRKGTSAGGGRGEAISIESVNPEDVITELLKEEKGEDYFSFFHAAAVSGDADAVLARAKELLPDNVYEELLSDAESARRSLTKVMEEGSRELKDEFREDFMRDMQQLITRSVVLLTAGVVYAFLPTFLFWGKISAAAAVSVAAGAVAITVMSIWRFYEFGGEVGESFEQWLKDVAVEPQASYALGASVISMATTMEISPVCCGIVLAVFAMYQAVDMLRTMIDVYEL
ncbi:MAG: hypothetical protein ISR78_07050 [Spirochaetia bacterium]|nr:hypothetical protein [Spirochaetia bacterium]